MIDRTIYFTPIHRIDSKQQQNDTVFVVGLLETRAAETSSSLPVSNHQAGSSKQYDDDDDNDKWFKRTDSGHGAVVWKGAGGGPINSLTHIIHIPIDTIYDLELCCFGWIECRVVSCQCKTSKTLQIFNT